MVLLIPVSSFRLASSSYIFKGSGLRFLTKSMTIYRQLSTSGSPKKLRILDELKSRRIVTLPNLLTFSRLVSTPFFPWMVQSGNLGGALGLLIYCGATDMLDGWIARRFNQTSTLGSVLDPIADKAAIIVFTSTLLVEGRVPAYLSALFLCKDFLMLLTGVFLRMRSLIGQNISPMQFFNPAVSSVEIQPIRVSKLNTVLQFLVLGLSLMPSTWINQEWAIALQISSAATTVISGLSHLFMYRKVVRTVRNK